MNRNIDSQNLIISHSNKGPAKPRWHDRISLTLKSLIVTTVLGLFLWGLLDYIQSSNLQKIFYIKLVEELTEQSMEYRLLFDSYIRLHHETAEIFKSQKNFSDYIDNQQWATDDIEHIKYYDRIPPWFLKPSAVRVLARPRYALLLDPERRVREVYSRSSYDSLPRAILHPSRLLLLKSYEQSLVASIDSMPYLITSEDYHDAVGNIKATLMLASPIDDQFLTTSIGNLPQGNYVSLVTPSKEPAIIISSNQNVLPAGTPIHTLSDRYIITGEQTYDYGSAEYLIKLVSLMSMAEVDKLTESVISTGRHQRNIIAPAFILTFALFMIMVTRRISRLNKRMSDFSQQTLGAKKHKVHQGDKLYLLERRFQRLTEEVVEAREMLKRQAEEKTRLIVNNARDAIVTMDSDGIVTTWNPQAEVTFGWTHDKAVGRRIDELIVPPQFRDAYRNSLQDFLAQEDSSIIDKQLQITALHSKGHIFPVELTISSASSDDRPFYIAIIRDISERTRAEKALKQSHERLITILDSLESIVYVADMETHEVLFANKHTQDIFGSIEGKVCWQVLKLDQSGPCNFCTNDKLLTVDGIPAGIHDWEFQNTSNDRWYYIQDRAIQWVDGRIVRMEIASDITERKETEKGLERSLREKEVLIKEIHHRVKNNMQVISSLLNLQSEQVRNEQYTELLNDSRSRIKAMALVHEKLYQSDNLADINFNDYIRTLTNGLFTFYGMNTGRILTKIDVHGVNLAIDTAIPCGLIINELVSNSFKHAFPEGRTGIVSITFALNKTSEGGREYDLTVSDNGVGIPEESEIRQLKSLGLQLVINLVEHQLGGSIRLQRNNGTQFHINFMEPSYKKRI